MLNTGDGRIVQAQRAEQAAAEARYERLNLTWRTRQERTLRNREAGWTAYHASQADQPYTPQPHSAAWLDGWRRASQGEEAPSQTPTVDLCPGVLAPPFRMAVDGDTVWCCSCCHWPLAERGAAHVPVHAAVEDVRGRTPLTGPAASYLETS